MALSEKQEEYVAYLLDPSSKPTKKAFAETLGVTDRTLRNWEHDREFKDELDRRCDALNLSTDRLQQVVSAMQHAAASGDVQAAKVYLAYVQQLGAIRKPPAEARAIEELSDEDLERAWKGEL